MTQTVRNKLTTLTTIQECIRDTFVNVQMESNQNISGETWKWLLTGGLQGSKYSMAASTGRG